MYQQLGPRKGLPGWMLLLLSFLGVGLILLVVLTPILLNVRPHPAHNTSTSSTMSVTDTSSTLPSGPIHPRMANGFASRTALSETSLHPADLLPNNDVLIYKGLKSFVPTVTDFLPATPYTSTIAAPVLLFESTQDEATAQACQFDAFRGPDVFISNAHVNPSLVVNPLNGGLNLFYFQGAWTGNAGGSPLLKHKRIFGPDNVFNVTQCLQPSSPWSRILAIRQARYSMALEVESGPDILGRSSYGILLYTSTERRFIPPSTELSWLTQIVRPPTLGHEELIDMYNVDLPSYIHIYLITGRRATGEIVVRHSPTMGLTWREEVIIQGALVGWTQERMPAVILRTDPVAIWIEQNDHSLKCYAKFGEWSEYPLWDISANLGSMEAMWNRTAQSIYLGTNITSNIVDPIIAPDYRFGWNQPLSAGPYLLQHEAGGSCGTGLVVDKPSCLAENLHQGCLTGLAQDSCVPNPLSIPGSCVLLRQRCDIPILSTLPFAAARLSNILVEPNTKIAARAHSMVLSRAGVLAVVYDTEEGDLKVAFFLPNTLERVGDYVIESGRNFAQLPRHLADKVATILAAPGSNGFLITYVSLQTTGSALDLLQTVGKQVDTVQRSRVRIVKIEVN